MNKPPLITYPARPVNGGRLEDAPAKVGPWIYQPKIKDWRAVVHVPTKRIWNRHGEPMSIADQLATALSILSFSSFDWLDVGVMDRQNQLLRNSIIVFDTMDADLVNEPQETRRHHLKVAFETLPSARALKPGTDKVFLIEEYQPLNATAATAIYQRLREQNEELGGNPGNPTDNKNFYEGLVAKRTDKPYPIQLISPKRETPWMMKHRFDQ